VLGMDAATGAVVTDYVHLRDVTGDTLGYVIDPAGTTASFGGPNDTLRVTDVAMHLLPPGSGFSFDTMTPSIDGTPIVKPNLDDHAAAAAAGSTFVAQAPAADVEAAAPEDAIHVTLADGLGLVGGLTVTPRLLPEQRWPQAFQLARAAGADAVAMGIDVGTGI